MIDERYWRIENPLDREYYRRRNTTGRAFLTLVDDSGAAQILQFEGQSAEIRSGMQRVAEFGFHSVPLVGANAVTLHHGGDRGFNTAIGFEDPRYRPKGNKPGESGIYGVDGADAKGQNGTMWWALRALKGQIVQLLGKTINIGAGSEKTLTITVDGNKVTITGASGDVIVDGVSLVNHTHGGVMSGASHTAKPDKA